MKALLFVLLKDFIELQGSPEELKKFALVIVATYIILCFAMIFLVDISYEKYQEKKAPPPS